MAPIPYSGTSGVEISGDFNDDAIFPDGFGDGTRGGPRFKTTVNEVLGGERIANVWWGQPLHFYSIAMGERTDAKLDQLLSFYRLRGGATEGFRFKDPFDCSTHSDFRSDPDPLDPAHRVAIAAGDGVTDEFRLCKRYKHTGYEVERPITHSREVAVWVDGVAQTEGVDFAVNHEAGVISFETAPVAGILIEWSGTHDVPVRFTAELDASYLHVRTRAKARRPDAMELVEIRRPILWNHPKHPSKHVAWSINDAHMITLSQGRMQTITPLRDGLKALLPRCANHPLGDEILTVFNGSYDYGLQILDADEAVLIGGLPPRGWAEFLLRSN